MKFRLAMCTLATLGVVLSACGMNRWQALSMLETGDNDYAVGRCGEISRFQIRAQLWPGGNFQNPGTALVVAKKIMDARLKQFEQAHKRPATDFEFYVLWNAPAEVDHPDHCVAERARRFANLVERGEPQIQAVNSLRKTTNAS